MTPGAEKNPNESLKEVAGSDNRIIDKKEFKNAEKVFDESYDAFMKGSGSEILALFDATELNKKIAEVVDKGVKKTAEKLDAGDKAYLVLKALKEGKKGDYASLLQVEIGKITLENKRVEFTSIIAKDKSLSEIEKTVLYEQLNDECKRASESNNPVGELEEHFGIALNTIKGTKALVEGLLKAFDPDTYRRPIKEFADICYKKGIEISVVVENTYGEAKEKTQAVYDEVLDWVNSTGKLTKEMIVSLIDAGHLQWVNFGNWCASNRDKTKEVYETTTKWMLETGKLAWSAFANFCASNRDKTKTVYETTTKWMLETGKLAWSAFANFCASERDKTKTVYETTTKWMLETGKLAWSAFANFCASNRDKTKTVYETTTKWMLETSKLAWSEFSKFCVSERDKTKTVYETTTKWMLETSKLAWDTFADFCISNRDKVQTSFETITKWMLETAKMSRNSLTVWSADKREIVKDTVGSMAKWLYESGKVVLDVIVDGLLLILGTHVLVAKFLIDTCAYTGEKLVQFGKYLGKNIYAAGQDVGELFSFLYEKVAKNSMALLDRVQEIVGDVKTVFNTLVALGKIKLDTGLNWLSLKYKNFVSMRKEIGQRGSVTLEKFTNRVGNARKTLKNKSTEYGKNIASFVQYLVDQGSYSIEQIGKWFVGAGESIAIFFNKLIELKSVALNVIAEWFTTAYKNIGGALDKLFQLGIGSWDKLGEMMHDAGISIEVIAKTIFKYVEVKAEKVCDFLLGLYNGATEKIDDVIDSVAAAIKNKAGEVRERAYKEYSKTMDAGKAAIKALEETKEWVAIKIEELGDWLMSKGVSTVDTIKTLKKNFLEYADQVGKYIYKKMDEATESVGDGLKALL